MNELGEVWHYFEYVLRASILNTIHSNVEQVVVVECESLTFRYIGNRIITKTPPHDLIL